MMHTLWNFRLLLVRHRQSGAIAIVQTDFSLPILIATWSSSGL